MSAETVESESKDTEPAGPSSAPTPPSKKSRRIVSPEVDESDERPEPKHVEHQHPDPASAVSTGSSSSTKMDHAFPLVPHLELDIVSETGDTPPTASSPTTPCASCNSLPDHELLTPAQIHQSARAHNMTETEIIQQMDKALAECERHRDHMEQDHKNLWDQVELLTIKVASAETSLFKWTPPEFDEPASSPDDDGTPPPAYPLVPIPDRPLDPERLLRETVRLRRLNSHLGTRNEVLEAANMQLRGGSDSDDIEHEEPAPSVPTKATFCDRGTSTTTDADKAQAWEKERSALLARVAALEVQKVKAERTVTQADNVLAENAGLKQSNETLQKWFNESQETAKQVRPLKSENFMLEGQVGDLKQKLSECNDRVAELTAELAQCTPEVKELRLALANNKVSSQNSMGHLRARFDGFDDLIALIVGGGQAALGVAFEELARVASLEPSVGTSSTTPEDPLRFHCAAIMETLSPSDLAELESALNSLAGAVKKQEALFSLKKLDQMEKDLAAAQQKESASQQMLARSESSSALAIRAANDEIAHLKANVASLQKMTGPNLDSNRPYTTATKESTLIDELTAFKATSTNRITELERSLQVAKDRLGLTESACRDAMGELSETKFALGLANTQLNHIQLDLAKNNDELDAAVITESKLRDAVASLEEQLNDATLGHQFAQGQVDDLENDIRSLLQECNAIESRETVLKRDLDECVRERNAARRQEQTLKDELNLRDNAISGLMERKATDDQISREALKAATLRQEADDKRIVRLKETIKNMCEERRLRSPGLPKPAESSVPMESPGSRESEDGSEVSRDLLVTDDTASRSQLDPMHAELQEEKISKQLVLHAAKTRITELEATVAQLNSDTLASRMTRVRELNLQLANIKLQHEQDIEQERAKARLEMDSLKKQMSELPSQQERVKFETELASIKKQAEATAKATAGTITQLQDRGSSDTNKIAQLEGEVRALKARHLQAVQDLEDRNRSVEDDLRSQIVKLSRELEKLLRNGETIKLRNVEGKLAISEGRYTQSQGMLRDAQAAKAKLSDEVDSLRRDLSDAKWDKKDLQTEVHELKDKLRDAVNTNHILNANRENVRGLVPSTSSGTGSTAQGGSIPMGSPPVPTADQTQVRVLRAELQKKTDELTTKTTALESLNSRVKQIQDNFGTQTSQDAKHIAELQGQVASLRREVSILKSFGSGPEAWVERETRARAANGSAPGSRTSSRSGGSGVKVKTEILERLDQAQASTSVMYVPSRTPTPRIEESWTPGRNSSGSGSRPTAA